MVTFSFTDYHNLAFGSTRNVIDDRYNKIEKFSHFCNGIKFWNLFWKDGIMTILWRNLYNWQSKFKNLEFLNFMSLGKLLIDWNKEWKFWDLSSERLGGVFERFSSFQYAKMLDIWWQNFSSNRFKSEIQDISSIFH